MTQSMTELQEQRKLLWKNVRCSHDLLARAHSVCEALERRYNHDKKMYEECDHELAMLDGRWQRIQNAKALAEEQGSGKKVKKVKAVVDLTEEQIIAIAARLGIVLPEVEPEVDEQFE
jgi:phage I-like protein